jgi:hypothetical protein
MDQSFRSQWCCGNVSVLSQPWSFQLWRQWIVDATMWDGSDYCLSICHVTCGAHVESVRRMQIVESFRVDWYGCEVWVCHIDFCIIFESVKLFARARTHTHTHQYVYYFVISREVSVHVGSGSNAYDFCLGGASFECQLNYPHWCLIVSWDYSHWGLNVSLDTPRWGSNVSLDYPYWDFPRFSSGFPDRARMIVEMRP